MSGAKWWQDPALCAYCGKKTGTGVKPTKDKDGHTCFKWKCQVCAWENSSYPPRVDTAKPRRGTQAFRHHR